MGPYKDFENVAGSKRDTQLDAETGRERSHERGRGSVRTAAVRHTRPGVRYVPASPTDNELIDAAVAAEALMAAMSAGQRAEQEVGVDRLQQASPEKKQKTTKMPTFGQAPPGLPQERHHPPLFHGPPTLGSTEAALPKERPEVYNLEEEPPLGGYLAGERQNHCGRAEAHGPTDAGLGGRTCKYPEWHS